MTWQEIFQTIWREHKKLIITILVVILGLTVVTTIITIITSTTPTEVQAPTPTEYVEKPSAELSDLDVTPQLDTINSVIRSAYGEALNDYEIATGFLLGDGSWYITTISQPREDQWSEAEDVYKIVLHGIAGEWNIAAPPSLIFTYADYPSVPIEVLVSANNL